MTSTVTDGERTFYERLTELAEGFSNGWKPADSANVTREEKIRLNAMQSAMSYQTDRRNLTNLLDGGRAVYDLAWEMGNVMASERLAHLWYTAENASLDAALSRAVGDLRTESVSTSPMHNERDRLGREAARTFIRQAGRLALTDEEKAIVLESLGWYA